MTDRIVSEEEVDKALHFLALSAIELGRVKTRAVKAEHMVKHIEALLSMASDEKSAEARKADARTSNKYLEAINEEAEAAGELAKLYALRQAAELRIEAWRSQQATFRSMKV